jgi:hypothetical protein|tara:strand:- start:403 stop:951 length:549 start_codon:yes stop_codon:yes gene_type:complete
MATLIIRPDAVASSTGFDQSGATLISRISDNDTGTRVIQNSVTSNITGIGFANDSNYSGATINSIQLSVTGASGGKSAGPSIVCLIKNGSTTLQSSELQFEEAGTLSGNVYSTSLTPTIVDNVTVTITPDNTGVAIFEVFITVDFTAGASGYGKPIMGVAAANIVSVSGVATANIANVIGVS